MAFTSQAPAGTDRPLARAFVAGEPDSMRAIFTRYAGPIHTVAFSRLGNHQLAEEAVQETLLKAWRARATFDPERELSPWLYQIARRVATDIYRRERRHRHHAVVAESISATGVATFSGTWEAWQVREALGGLPPEERDLIRLTHYVGLTQSQIAERLELPIGTVKTRVYRAHRRLAAQLDHLRETTP
jgi:RNA polymerase sigma-70 factor (ECF subfamily)